MSIQWTLVAGFLYSEMALLLLLSIPFITARRWNKLFKSRFLQVIANQGTWYFAVILFTLTLLLLDAIREMRKYSTKEIHDHSHLTDELQISMKLFRAQRNFYIAGIALFLCLVIKRVSQLISRIAQLEAENEAALKQARSASVAASSILKNQGSGEDAQNTSSEVNELNAKLEEYKKKIKSLEKENEAILSQAKSVEREYDRLSEEHKKLQLKVEEGKDTKKDA